MLNFNNINFQAHLFHTLSSLKLPFYTSVNLISPGGLTNNSFFFKVDHDTFSIILILSCFLLSILVVTVVFMSSASGTNHLHNISKEENHFNKYKSDLGRRLMAQLIHNNASTVKITCLSFPSNKEGFLDMHNRTRLVSILRNSPIADNYRFGSSLGTIYIKGTNKYPFVDPAMIGVVLAAD